jgi:hypothetical protein
MGFTGPRTKAFSLPAPTGGWNRRDPISEMAPNDAVYLTNWFPKPSAVVLRGGYTQYSTGYPSQVETVMAYAGGTTDKLFGVSNGNIYDATSGGAIGAAAVSGLSNSRLQYINVATSGGQFMLAVNGADKLRGYSGSAWWTDGDGTHDITGVDTSTLIGINLFKSRVWFVQKDTLVVWYLGVNAIAGAASSFDLRSVAKLGGYVMAMGTWTIDAGQGVDDYAVFVTNKGEVIIYQGTDPSSANTWALKGVWLLGAPVGRRCMQKIAGDILLICQDGLLPLSESLQSSRVNPRVALTDKIQAAMSEAVSNYGSNFGWQTVYYPKDNMLMLNVPISVGSQEQYVMNTISKAWCDFTGWHANCWEIYQDNPYFGGNGFIGLAQNGTSDNGTNIVADAKQAFNYFGNRGILKRFSMMRPILQSNGSPAFVSGINVDFDDTGITGLPNFTPSVYGTWDSSLWDQGLWSGGLSIIKNWQGINGIGTCAAIRLGLQSMGLEVEWASTDITMEVGAVL